MDVAVGEEPQKKIFRARKTMKMSDRQQLESLHNALLGSCPPSPASPPLVNGKHGQEESAGNEDNDENVACNGQSKALTSPPTFSSPSPLTLSLSLSPASPAAATVDAKPESRPASLGEDPVGKSDERTVQRGGASDTSEEKEKAEEELKERTVEDKQEDVTLPQKEVSLSKPDSNFSGISDRLADTAGQSSDDRTETPKGVNPANGPETLVAMETDPLKKDGVDCRPNTTASSPSSSQALESDQELKEGFLVLSEDDSQTEKEQREWEGEAMEVDVKAGKVVVTESAASPGSSSALVGKDDIEIAGVVEGSHGRESPLSRKRSLCVDDEDSVAGLEKQEKRLRVELMEREELEAHLELKFTGDEPTRQRLEKVVQHLVAEQLRALQLSVFDRSLQELRERVEKLDCAKKHQQTLTSLQAKIARLAKKFGAANQAKENAKRPQEVLQTPASATSSPSKPSLSTPESRCVIVMSFQKAMTDGHKQHLPDSDHEFDNSDNARVYEPACESLAACDSKRSCAEDSEQVPGRQKSQTLKATKRKRTDNERASESLAASDHDRSLRGENAQVSLTSRALKQKCKALVSQPKQTYMSTRNSKRVDYVAWSKVSRRFSPRLTKTLDRPTEVLAAIDKSSNELEVFSVVFPRSLLVFIAQCTNNHLQKLRRDRNANIPDTDYSEIMLVLGVVLVMSYNRIAHFSDYWSSGASVGNDIKNAITRNRCRTLLSKMYFNNPVKDANAPKTYYIDEVVACFKKTFMEAREESPFQSIKESMTKSKEQSTLKQHTPLKPNKYAMWERSDVKTGYTYDINVYSHVDLDSADGEGRTLGERVVRQLCSTIRDPDVTLAFGGFFNSVHLMDTIAFPSVGACVSTMKNMPTFPDKLCRWQSDFQQCHTGTLAARWRGSKDMVVLSNCHGPGLTKMQHRQKDGTVETTECPLAIADYNRLVEDVDLSDQKVSLYDFDGKPTKWWRKAFCKLYLTAVVNSYILFQETKGRKISLMQYIVPLAEAMLAHGKQNAVVERKKPVRPPVALKHVGDHLLVGVLNRRRCVRCAKKNRQTRTKTVCSVCQVGFCKKCFDLCHK